MWPFDWFSKKEYCDNCKTQLTLEDRHPLPLCNISKMASMPIVKPCKPEHTDGISEPILSFVELFKKNHRRFTVESIFRDSGDSYKLKDKSTGEEFSLPGYCGRYRVKGNLWITEYEVKYIYNVVSTLHRERAKRKAELVNNRKRKKYMKLYGPKEI